MNIRLALAENGHALVIDLQMQVFHRAEFFGQAEGGGQHVVEDRRFLVPELVEILHLKIDLGAGAEDFLPARGVELQIIGRIQRSHDQRDAGAENGLGRRRIELDVPFGNGRLARLA